MTQPTLPSIEHLEGATEFLSASGLRFEEVTGSRVTGWIDLTSAHHQPFGLVHGGVYCSAVESAASVGATTAVWDDGLVAVGVNNNTNFVASITEGRVDVVAEPVVQGRTQQLWNVRITRHDDDRLVATGQVRLQNVTPR
jgi:1,4-dihydroxy-2-naphthoyl-CoA hydrolase